MAFISFNNTTVTIDGSAAGADRTKFSGGESAVQLRRSRQEESGFDWSGRKITQVVVKNMLVYDDVDIRCLRWFIYMKMKIDMSESYLSPDCLSKLIPVLEDLKERKVTVVEGSSIQVPVLGGFSGVGRTAEIHFACKDIGFNVIGSDF